jgi:hypothetical protein
MTLASEPRLRSSHIWPRHGDDWWLVFKQGFDGEPTIGWLRRDAA